jgi:hypothetical protein
VKTAVLQRLPELPAHLEWVIHAEPDRVTVNLSYKVPVRSDESSDDARAGYVKSHTHRHQCPIAREEWEELVVNAANHLWTHYTEGIQYAQWADEIMRRSR